MSTYVCTWTCDLGERVLKAPSCDVCVVMETFRKPALSIIKDCCPEMQGPFRDNIFQCLPMMMMMMILIILLWGFLSGIYDVDDDDADDADDGDDDCFNNFLFNL